MSEVTDATLKTYFQTGSRPTAAQYENLIDSKVNTNITSGGGSLAVTDKFNRFDVREYLPSGYVTDGSVDYTTQIQAAITAAEASSVRDVYLPEGSFAVSALTITKLLRLHGAGRRHTNLIADGTGSGAVIAINPAAATSGIMLSDLRIDLSGEASATGVTVNLAQRAHITNIMVQDGATGIAITNCGTCFFERIRLSDQTTAGLTLQGDGGTEHYFNDLHIEALTAALTTGLLVTRTTTADTGGLYFKNLRIVRTGAATMTTGMHLNCTGGTTTMPVFMSAGCVIDGVGTTSLKMTSVAQSYIVGSWFTSTGGHAIEIDGGSDHYIAANNMTSINLLNAPAAVTVIGNRMGGTYAINIDTGSPPTLMTVSGNRTVGTLTNAFPELTLAASQSQSLPHEILTHGGGAAADTLAIRNADNASKPAAYVRTSGSGDLAFLDNSFNPGMTLRNTSHRLDVYGPLTVSGNTSGPAVYSYDGTPESALTAEPGSFCMNVTPASTEYAVYIKRTGSGNTGWEGLGTVLP